MKNQTSCVEVIHKEVVIIGNGPSGISLSMMLAGNLPYLISQDHPDEMLSARLHSSTAESLAQQPLDHLAAGLEGRSANPVSLLLDALEHPFADLGIEMPSLVQWQRHKDKQIDHVVLGKGPPGGSWHTMDPNVLTLSLGSWMALPGYPYWSSDTSDSQRRASAGSVAQYYKSYVKEMNLSNYFNNNVYVLNIEVVNKSTENNQTNDKCVTSDDKLTNYNNESIVMKNKDCDVEYSRRKCSFVSALNFIRSRTKCQKQKSKDQINCVGRSCKRPRESYSKHENNFERKMREIIDKSYRLMTDTNQEQCIYLTEPSRYSCRKGFGTTEDDCDVNRCNTFPVKTHICNRNKIRSLSLSSDYDTTNFCDNNFSECTIDNQKHNSLINISECKLCHCFQDKSAQQDDLLEMEVLSESSDSTEGCKSKTNIPNNVNWIVHTIDLNTGRRVSYSCNNLVLANGASDLPNRLGLPTEAYDLPWVLHDLRTLEHKLDEFTKDLNSCPDPVLIVGAGLSAADAVIATRFRSIPVLHVFRNRSAALDKQLPENMYPEYHKVHQMMLDGGSTYPLYTALPEHTVTDISAENKTVTLVSNSGVTTKHKVSFVVILIGSRPDLKFLPKECNLGVKKSTEIDAKSNPIDIDQMSHCVKGYDNLYAIGPLAGDNFVRFIPGGALAVTSHMYKKRNW